VLITDVYKIWEHSELHVHGSEGSELVEKGRASVVLSGAGNKKLSMKPLTASVSSGVSRYDKQVCGKDGCLVQGG
jgi:hypothetical protein